MKKKGEKKYRNFKFKNNFKRLWTFASEGRNDNQISQHDTLFG